jgi:hypothetical protein
LQTGVETLAELQDKLYGQDRWSVLLIFQAMDAAGKDGTIKHVMSGVNPQGCQVSSFKAPTSEDLDHDYLWRCMKELPERGRIGIFNRSYYEETLVVRVHPEFLAGRSFPRMRDEEHLGRAVPGHPRVRALPASQRNDRAEIFPPRLKEEQKKRFLARLDLPEKNWKFSATTRRSAASGTTTWRLTRTRSARRRRRIRRGMWCRRTTSGSRACRGRGGDRRAGVAESALSESQ